MLKEIIAGVLGFLTLPIVGLIILGLVEAGKLIGGFGMEPQHYWAGFFLLIGIGVVFAASIPFWAT
jgi:hypothetical protein